MKRICILSLLVMLTAASFAQKPSAEAIRKRFSLCTSLYNDFWQKVPDSVNNRFLNQGADVYVLYTFPMDRKNHLSFFIGAGLGSHNMYVKSQLKLDANKKTIFADFPTTVNSNDISVKKYKLSLTYFDIPFGFQYKASNKIHGTLGFKVGWVINDHTKYKGTDYSSESIGLKKKKKSANLPNIQNIHYGPYLTLGYKWIGLTASYQITSVFDKDMGPQIYPISVGLTFRPF